MSVFNLFDGSNADVQAKDMEELHNILNATPDDDALSRDGYRTISCSGATGIAWLSSESINSRLVGFYNRKMEDLKIAKNYQNTFRLYHDLLLVVTPQVRRGFDCELTLSLVDSGTDLNKGLEAYTTSADEVILQSSEGPVVVGLPCEEYTIPMQDRITLDGKVMHRRLGVKYHCKFPSSNIVAGDKTTYFTLHASWRQADGVKSGNWEVPPPFIVKINTGFFEHTVIKDRRMMKALLNKAIITSKHVKTPTTTSGDVLLANKSGSVTNMSNVFEPPKPIKRATSTLRQRKLATKDNDSHRSDTDSQQGSDFRDAYDPVINHNNPSMFLGNHNSSRFDHTASGPPQFPSLGQPNSRSIQQPRPGQGMSRVRSDSSLNRQATSHNAPQIVPPTFGTYNAPSAV